VAFCFKIPLGVSFMRLVFFRRDRLMKEDIRQEEKPVIIYRHQLREKDGRWSGFDRDLGGFFLVARESILPPDVDVFDAKVVRTIIDKRGQEVPIVLLTPHEHRFEPYHISPETQHWCPLCRLTESHRAVCPNRHCEGCGMEMEPQHQFERLLRSYTRVVDGGKKLEEVSVWECVGCNTQKEFVLDIIPNPFYPEKVFETFEELRDAILECEKLLPSILPPPDEPRLERQKVARESWTDSEGLSRIRESGKQYEVLDEKYEEVTIELEPKDSDWDDEQIYPSLGGYRSEPTTIRRRVKMYKVRVWDEELTPESEQALKQWRLDVERWANELPIEHKVAIAAAIASEDAGEKRGSREWVKRVGEILSFYSAFGLADALRRLKRKG
jgi:hypothetical protein